MEPQSTCPINEFTAEVLAQQRFARVYAYKLTRNYEDTNDLVQDAFERVFANAEKHAAEIDRQKIRAWLGSIIYHRFIDIKRRKCNQPKAELKPWDAVKADNEDGFEKEDLAKAILKLGAENARVLNLGLQGYRYREIADLVGATEPRVRLKIYRAKRQLKKIMGKMGYKN